MRINTRGDEHVRELFEDSILVGKMRFFGSLDIDSWDLAKPIIDGGSNSTYKVAPGEVVDVVQSDSIICFLPQLQTDVFFALPIDYVNEGLKLTAQAIMEHGLKCITTGLEWVVEYPIPKTVEIM